MRKRLASAFLMICVGVFFGLNAHAQSLDSATGSVDLLDSITFHNYSELQNKDQLRERIHSHDTSLAEQLNDSRWQKTSIDIAASTGPWWLEIGDQGMWEDLVVVVANRLSKKAIVLHDGELIADRPLLMRSHWLEIQGSDVPQSFDIYVSQKLKHRQLRVRQLVAMTDHFKQKYFLHITPIIYAFLASLSILLIYNFMFSWRLRSLLHATYAFYCGTIILFIGMSFSVTYDIAWYEKYNLSNRDVYLFAGALLQISMYGFYYSFIENNHKNTLIWRLIGAIVSVNALLSIAMAYTPYNSILIPDVIEFNIIFVTLAILFFIVSMYAFIKAWRKGSQNAAFLFFAQLPIIMMLIVHIIARLVGISSRAWITYQPFAIPLAYVAEMLILSYAMTERVRVIRDQSLLGKAKAERDLKLFFQEQNNKLEQLVKERTLELEEAIRVSDELARTDSLSGLNNRRAFCEHGAIITEQAKRYGDGYAVIALDIDFFKEINDTYGHGVGDTVIAAIARLVQGALRAVDISGRIGGDEFAIILPKTTLASACEVAERIRLAIAAKPLQTEKGNISITASLGVAAYQEPDCVVDHTLARADRALYQAKELGRNVVVPDIKNIPLCWDNGCNTIKS